MTGETLGDGPTLGPGTAPVVATTVRKARHGVLEAIRTELGVAESMKPEDNFNPFDGTDLAPNYRELNPPRETDRPAGGR